jgi:hypothetical protein
MVHPRKAAAHAHGRHSGSGRSRPLQNGRPTHPRGGSMCVPPKTTAFSCNGAALHAAQTAHHTPTGHTPTISALSHAHPQNLPDPTYPTYLSTRTSKPASRPACCHASHSLNKPHSTGHLGSPTSTAALQRRSNAAPPPRWSRPSRNTCGQHRPGGSQHLHTSHIQPTSQPTPTQHGMQLWATPLAVLPRLPLAASGRHPRQQQPTLTADRAPMDTRPR